MIALRMTRKTADDAHGVTDKPAALLQRLPADLPLEALDRIAIVGTSGSGKTYTAKGLVEPPPTTPELRLALERPAGRAYSAVMEHGAVR
jgi:hypothetical protein